MLRQVYYITFCIFIVRNILYLQILFSLDTFGCHLCYCYGFLGYISLHALGIVILVFMLFALLTG